MKNPFSSSRKGWECNDNPEGTKNCKRIERNKTGELVTSGSEVTLGVDDKCNIMMTGNNVLMDDESEDLDKIAKRMVAGCKKELA